MADAKPKAKPKAKPSARKSSRVYETPAQDKIAAVGIDAICERVAEGHPYRVIASDIGVGRYRLMLWLAEHPEQFAAAKAMRAHTLVEDIIDIADDSSQDVTTNAEGREMINSEFVQRSKLRVDARKWVAARMLPSAYGDKVQVGGAADLPPVQSQVNNTIDVRALNDAELDTLIGLLSKSVGTETSAK